MNDILGIVGMGVAGLAGVATVAWVAGYSFHHGKMYCVRRFAQRLGERR